MPCGCEGEGLHFPPVSEALSRARPTLNARAEEAPLRGLIFLGTSQLRVAPEFLLGAQPIFDVVAILPAT